MRFISCKLEDLRKMVLPIGYEGENDHTRVQVDAGEVFKEYPAAVPSLKVHGPGGTIYPAEVTRDGKNVIWDIKASDCAADGSGEAQFTFTLNNVIVKSCIAKIKVYRSIVGGSTPPDPVQDWIDDAEEVLDDLAAMDNIAKTAEAGDVGKALSPKTVVDGVVTEWQYVEPGAGTEDYTDLENKPQIGGVTLSGDKSLHDLGIAAESAIPDVSGKANLSVVAPAFVKETANDAGSLVTYTDGVVYVLPEGHTAGTTWANTQKTATNIAEQQRLLLTDIDGILEHETYIEGGGSDYDPVTVYNTINGAYININSYNYAYISTPSTVDVKVYKIENGKTYKVKGRGKTDRPVYIAADNASTAGTIAEENQFDYVYGTGSSLAVEEKEYTSTRNGYLYITYSSDECGLWVKNDTQVTKYHIDDVLCDVADIKNDILSLNNAIFKTQIDSASALIKRVPRNAEPIAKVKSIANTVTVVRSITGRNLANKDTVGDVDVSGTTKKGIKTIRVPSGRYYVILGNMGVNTKVDKVDGKTHTTLYQDQFPMRLNITDPSGGYFIVYAGSVSSLGDMSGLMIGKLRDDETTLAFEAYKEKTYTPDDLAVDNSIEVRPDGFIEFVNSGNNAVSSSIEYTVSGRGDDSTTRKEFIVSPDGSKFLPMVKDDGYIACARVVPKKALFIGNSLTSGWQTFGEAATEVDKDYIALFGDVVDNIESSYTFSRVWATGFEQQTSLANAQSWTTTNIDPSLSSDLDLIVVQLSENVVDNASAVATFPSSSLWLLEHLRSECPKARVVWMGVWFDRGWVNTLLNNTKKTGCEYIDIRPLYLPENVSYPGMLYEMESDYAKEYTVDSFSVSNGTITLNFTIEGTQYTATIPSYTSYTSGSETSITVTGVYHVVTTYYTYIHPGDEGFRKIANKLLYDLGISDSEETIPADA